MTIRRHHEPESLETLQDGEFRRISGIGPGIEHRLKDAGIVRFEQLAALATADILAALSGIVGITEEKIRQQDWNGQARRLAQDLHSQKMSSSEELAESQPALSSQQRLAAPLRAAEESYPEEAGRPFDEGHLMSQEHHPERPYYESFLVELLFSKEGSVRRTRVVQVQNGANTTWAGWDPARLLEWVEQRAGVAPEMPDPQSPSILAGEVEMKDLKLIPLPENEPGWLLSTGQPFEVRLTLDLSRVQAAPGARLHYQVLVDAYRLGVDMRQNLGRQEGEFHVEASFHEKAEVRDEGVDGLEDARDEFDLRRIPVTIRSNGIHGGTYRLEAILRVSDAEDPQRSTPRPDESDAEGLWAFLEGGLIQVLAIEKVM